MFKQVRERLGSAGLVVAIVALIVALSGGAYAATSGSGGGKATASSGKRGKPGKQGKPGKPGPAGPQGPQGVPGPKGDTGAPGQNGTNGVNGADGKSVITSIEPEGANCAEGGTKLVGTVTTYACNGEEGEEGPEGPRGPEGSPWTVGGVLPPGETETGAWAFNANDADAEIFVPISFTLPLGVELGEEDVHFQNVPSKPAFEAACPLPGSASEPAAPPGKLCIYFNSFGGAPVNATFTRISKLTILNEPGSNSSGAVLEFAFSGAAGELAQGSGSWAVTAAEP